MESQKNYAPWLWFLLGLFCLRVSAQLIQYYFPTPYLPPFERWQSGLLPYGILVLAQFMIIGLYVRVAWGFSHAQIQVNPKLGHGLVYFGRLYVGVMVIRYIVYMGIHPEERWFGGCLPIFFHLVLASFLLIWGHYHRTQGPQLEFTRQVY